MSNQIADPHHPFTPHCAICVNTRRPPWNQGSDTVKFSEGTYRVCPEHAAYVGVSLPHETLWDILAKLRSTKGPTPGNNAA